MAALFSTGPWSSCIVTGHDRLMTFTSRRLRLLHASRSTASTGSRASNRVRFAGSVSCFTSIAIDRARTSRSSQRRWRDHASDRSIGSVSTASKRRHMAWCCVCMHVNETGHAQRLNMLKERPRKWFFREEVDFLASLAFVVNCGHTIDLQQVQAKRFSFLLEVTCALAPGPWRSTRL